MRLAAWLVIPLGLCAGCADIMKRLTVDQTAGVLADAGRAFDRENDVELARAAIPASLKTVEGFLEAHPHQRILLRLLAENYMSYAFGFLEDEAEAVQDSDPARAEALRQRALNLHLRARGFGLRLLALDLPELAVSLERGEAPTPEQLDTAWSREHLEGLFWAANPWGAAINVGKDQPALVAQVGIVKALIERCAAIDDTYYWGGPHLALGALEAAMPVALGGDAEAARQHFERALEITEGQHLMTKVLYARLVGTQTGDRALFERVLGEVLSVEPDINPRLVLANTLAQLRARRYLAAIDDYFI